MAYMTPLESALSADLERIDLPFERRGLIYDDALRHYASIQKMPKEDIERMPISRLREDLLKRKASGIDWSYHLVYNITGISKALLQLIYAVSPSEENETLFRNFGIGQDFESILDGILMERSFYCEEVFVEPRSLYEKLGCPMPVKDDDKGKRTPLVEIPDPLKAIRKLRDVLEFSQVDENDGRNIRIEFYSTTHIVRNVGPNAPQNIFDGIESAVDDAAELSKRICEYLMQSEDLISSKS